MARAKHFSMQTSNITTEPTLGMWMIDMDPDAREASDFRWQYTAESHDGLPYQLTDCEPCNALALLSRAFLELMSAEKCDHSLLHFLIHADAMKRFAEHQIPRPIDL